MVELVKCPCGLELARRDGNRVILVNAGEDGKHTILVDLVGAGDVVKAKCGRCGRTTEMRRVEE